MADIVERLRKMETGHDNYGHPFFPRLMAEAVKNAADAISARDAEIERLRAVLAVTHATIDDKNRRLAAIRGVLNSDNEQKANET